MQIPVEKLVEQAVKGDSDALESVIMHIQDRIYGLAVRMLWHPEDAEDATQEILVKIVTHLGDFRQESSFTTWCYRIATNHLLTARKRRAELAEMTFEKFEEEISDGLAYAASHDTYEPEQDLLAKEVMIGCIQGAMLCLDRPHRLTYLLGEIYGVNSEKGGAVLGISPQAFRKRLSRARAQLRDCLMASCGLVNPSNPCTCAKQVPYALKTGLVNPRRLLFATHQCSSAAHDTTAEQHREVDESQRIAMLLREPEYAAPHAFVKRVRAMIDAGTIEVAESIQ